MANQKAIWPIRGYDDQSEGLMTTQRAWSLIRGHVKMVLTWCLPGYPNLPRVQWQGSQKCSFIIIIIIINRKIKLGWGGAQVFHEFNGLVKAIWRILRYFLSNPTLIFIGGLIWTMWIPKTASAELDIFLSAEVKGKFSLSRGEFLIPSSNIYI